MNRQGTVKFSGLHILYILTPSVHPYFGWSWFHTISIVVEASSID